MVGYVMWWFPFEFFFWMLPWCKNTVGMVRTEGWNPACQMRLGGWAPTTRFKWLYRTRITPHLYQRHEVRPFAQGVLKPPDPERGLETDQHGDFFFHWTKSLGWSYKLRGVGLMIWKSNPPWEIAWTLRTFPRDPFRDWRDFSAGTKFSDLPKTQQILSKFINLESYQTYLTILMLDLNHNLIYLNGNSTHITVNHFKII